jgi:hypothetical protein
MPILSTSEQANLIRKREVANDKFYTPESLVKIHLELVRPHLYEGDLILEPCRGKGAYYNLFYTYFPTQEYDWCEIDDGRDFFNYKGNPDVIITNPPFSLLKKMIERMIELKPRVISLLLNAYAMTPCRIRTFNAAGYYIVEYHLTRVNRWFGCSVVVVLSREGSKNLIGFDVTKHILSPDAK